MKKVFTLAALLLLISCAEKKTKTDQTDKITVAAYYFPGFHPMLEHELNYSLQHPKDWTEWELVKEARPRFEGHQQPNEPLWGYQDESDPAVMAKKIDAAADHGLDVFVFDWYWYEGVPFLNRPLDDGFLKAPNVDRLQFALMWANHDWWDRFPFTYDSEIGYMYDGTVDSAMYDKVCDELVHKYFTHPQYWKIDGKPYFSIYNLNMFLENFGQTSEVTRKGMELLEAKARAAGLPGVYWSAMIHGTPGILDNTPMDFETMINKLGFDAASSYIWIHQVDLPEVATDYNYVRDGYLDWIPRAYAAYPAYIPNFTMGWDPSPRTNQQRDWSVSYDFPYWETITNNTPENFKTALEMLRDTLLAHPEQPQAFIINAWNEWTESSYLEPDTKNGMKYLEAIRDVFGTSDSNDRSR